MKNMKRFAALMMLLCALMICTIPAKAMLPKTRPKRWRTRAAKAM